MHEILLNHASGLLHHVNAICYSAGKNSVGVDTWVNVTTLPLKALQTVWVSIGSQHATLVSKYLTKTTAHGLDLLSLDMYV